MCLKTWSVLGVSTVDVAIIQTNWTVVNKTACDMQRNPQYDRYGKHCPTAHNAFGV